MNSSHGHRPRKSRLTLDRNRRIAHRLAWMPGYPNEEELRAVARQMIQRSTLNQPPSP